MNRLLTYPLLLCGLMLLFGVPIKGEERLSLVDGNLSSTTLSGSVNVTTLWRMPEEIILPTFNPQLAKLLRNIQDDLATRNDSPFWIYDRPTFDLVKPRYETDIQAVPEPATVTLLVIAVALARTVRPRSVTQSHKD